MEDHKNWQSEPNPCLASVMKYNGNVKVRSTIIDKQEDRNDVEYTYWKYYSDSGHALCNEITSTGEWVVRKTLSERSSRGSL